MQRLTIANTALFCVLYEFFAMRISARFFDKDSIRSMSGIPRSARRLALNDEGERELFVVILKLNVQFPSYPSFRGAAALPLLSRGYDVATWNPPAASE